MARESFTEGNPELLKRFCKASIRADQFTRMKENFPLFRFVEAEKSDSMPTTCSLVDIRRTPWLTM